MISAGVLACFIRQTFLVEHFPIVFAIYTIWEHLTRVYDFLKYNLGFSRRNIIGVYDVFGRCVLPSFFMSLHAPSIIKNAAQQQTATAQHLTFYSGHPSIRISRSRFCRSFTACIQIMVTGNRTDSSCKGFILLEITSRTLRECTTTVQRIIIRCRAIRKMTDDELVPGTC